VLYELIIFDLDGTLIDSSRDLANAANHALRQLGYPEHPREVVLRYVGDGARQLIERALPADARHRTDEALTLYRDYYAAHLLDSTRPYDGIETALAKLGAGRQLAICTNKPARATAAIVDGLGWRGRFAHVLGGDELSEKKPHALPVTTLCERAGIARNKAVLVGDGTQDAGAARAAGVAYCAVLWGFSPRESLEALSPRYLASRPADLLALLGT
jgi:phosphoglycolate phosphatase